MEKIIDGKKAGITELCPFCGSDEIVLMQYDHDAGLRYKVFCCGCSAGIEPGWAQEPGNVVDIWNKRIAK